MVRVFSLALALALAIPALAANVGWNLATNTLLAIGLFIVAYS